MLEAEADIGPRHREPPHGVEAGAIFGARASAGTCAARGPCRTAPRPGSACPAATRRAPPPPSRHGRSRSATRRARRRGCRASAARRWRSTASASPRKPKLVTSSIWSSGSFEVAWRSSARCISARRHPAAVVDHLDQVEPARREPDRDLPRTRVEAVFDQLLQRARRAFDHLARGDAIDEVGREPSY